MLDLTRGANYSFHGLLLLATAGPGQVLSIGQLARGVRASPTYMAKLLKRLAEAKLLEAHRGKNGGYSLGRPADSISLRDVVSALEATEPQCLAILPLCSQCPLSPECPVNETLADASDDLRRRLDAVSVGELARRLEKTAGPQLSTRAAGKAPQWPRLRRARPVRKLEGRRRGRETRGGALLHASTGTGDTAGRGRRRAATRVEREGGGAP